MTVWHCRCCKVKDQNLFPLLCFLHSVRLSAMPCKGLHGTSFNSFVGTKFCSFFYERRAQQGFSWKSSKHTRRTAAENLLGPFFFSAGGRMLSGPADWRFPIRLNLRAGIVAFENTAQMCVQLSVSVIKLCRKINPLQCYHIHLFFPSNAEWNVLCPVFVSCALIVLPPSGLSVAVQFFFFNLWHIWRHWRYFIMKTKNIWETE